METAELLQLPLLVMTVASVVLPFMYAVPKDAGGRFAAFPLDAGRRKQRLLALLLLAVLVVGVYALVRYRPISLWFLIVAPLVFLLTVALFWTSLTGELTIFKRGERYVLSHDRDAFLFWYFAAGAAACNFAAIRLLREWFVQRARARPAG